MRLKVHREDVKWMKEYAVLPLPYLDEIAARYQRLILMAEKQFDYLEEFNGPDREPLWPQEKRVLKDAEVKE